MKKDTTNIIKRTKIGLVMPVILLSSLPISWVFLLIPDSPIEEYLYLMLFSVVVILLVVLFISLTIRVGKKSLQFYFGPFFLLKSIPLSHIQSVTKTKISWFRSFGVSMIRNGIVYALSGGDGMELVLRNGYRFQIGVDAVDEVNKALSNQESYS